jgi:hypothetical protein
MSLGRKANCLHDLYLLIHKTYRPVTAILPYAPHYRPKQPSSRNDIK